MRKIFYILAVAIATFMQGCDFLEVETLGKSDIDTFFADIDGLRSAKNGAYRVTYDFYDNEFMKYPEVAGNMVRLSATAGEDAMLNQYNFTSAPNQETTAVGYIWKRGFIIMSNVNNILTFAPSLINAYPNNESEIKCIEAHALYLRALAHLDICLCYGQHYTYTNDASHLGIPVLTRLPAAGETILRDNVSAVYKRILADLNEAIKLFDANQGTESKYFASADACKALLARVYLYMEDWENASKFALELMERYKLTPRDKYEAMFNDPAYMGDEVIFRLNGAFAGSNTKRFYDYQTAKAFPADTLYTLFNSADDIRLRLLEHNGEHYCMKFSPIETLPEDDKHYDPIISRLSEMYLIHAEAECHLNNLTAAASDIKALMARALGVNESAVTLNYSGQAELLGIILKERVKELCFEGHNFFDITRNKKDLVREKGTNSTVRLLRYPNDLFVLPIPQIEMDANIGIQPNPTVNN